VREEQEEPGEAEESLCSVKCTLTEAQEGTRPLQCRFALYARLHLDKARARIAGFEKLASSAPSRSINTAINFAFLLSDSRSWAAESSRRHSRASRRVRQFAFPESRRAGSFRSRKGRYFAPGTRSLRLIGLMRVVPDSV